LGLARPARDDRRDLRLSAPKRRLTATTAWRLAPVAASAALAVVYLAIDPHTRDLAAHVYRAELFEREGFTLWNGNWYGGHHTPAYSVLFPPLGALLGPSLVGALSAVAAAALFDPLARGHFGERARWGALWFGAGSATLVFTGRMPFALGVALGLGALLAFQRERRTLAIVLALLCPLASPVAGLFLAVAGGALLLGRRRLDGLALAAAALGPALLLSLVFPEGGREPFHSSAFWPLPAFCAGCLLLLPRGERTLRVGAVLFLLLSVALFVLDNPVGGNVARLALFAGPIAACALAGRRLPAALLVPVFAALAWWQLSPAVRDVRDALDDPASEAAYYEPLNDFLGRNVRPGERVEVVFTQSHWESAEVADRFPIARGWQRQLDIKNNELFYEGRLDDRRYSAWLAAKGVAWVALADAELDYSARREAELVRRDPAYLRLRGRPGRWRVYEVAPPHAIAPRGAEAARSGPTDLLLRVRRSGAVVLRVNWTPYWLARGACVERAPGGVTRLTVPRPGRVRLVTSFSLGRVGADGPRCG
jgi:hypothetical protein